MTAEYDIPRRLEDGERIQGDWWVNWNRVADKWNLCEKPRGDILFEANRVRVLANAELLPVSTSGGTSGWFLSSGSWASVYVDEDLSTVILISSEMH